MSNTEAALPIVETLANVNAGAFASPLHCQYDGPL